MSIHVTLVGNVLVFISQGVILYYNICGTTRIRLIKYALVCNR